MKNWIVGILAAIAVDVAFLDGEADKTVTVLVITYSDGTEDKIVVKKKDLVKNHTSLVELADQIIQRHEN